MSHTERKEGFLNNTLGAQYTFLLRWVKIIEISFLYRSKHLKTKSHTLLSVKESCLSEVLDKSNFFFPEESHFFHVFSLSSLLCYNLFCYTPSSQLDHNSFVLPTNV